MSSYEKQKLISYYEQTADFYDKLHLHEGDEHYTALNLLSSFIKLLNINSILDVGCGTGRALKYLNDNHPTCTCIGVDISKELLKIAFNKKCNGHLIQCDAYSLPLKSGSVDAAVAMGVLHHVKDPNQVIREMLRVSKKAIFISDGNRFGQGGAVMKLIKLALWCVGLWKLANYIKTKGRGYTMSEGDGITFSYSVYDSIALLKRGGMKVIAIPTIGSGDLATFPILSAPHLFVCAIKK